MISIRISLALAVLISQAATAADQYPTDGMLFNTVENSSLTYRCQPPQGGQLVCDFVQSSIRFKAKAGDLAKALADARKQFKDNPQPNQEECGMFRQIGPILEGKVQPPNGKPLPMTAVEKRDMLRSANLFIKYCDSPSEETVLAFVRAEQEEARRTCKISSNTFQQTFRVPTDEPGKRVWVTQSTPSGACGFVQLDRFEADPQNGGFTPWNYVARRAITNPNAEWFPGTKCAGFDERTYPYSWRSRKPQMSCDYVEFTPM